MLLKEIKDTESNEIYYDYDKWLAKCKKLKLTMSSWGNSGSCNAVNDNGEIRGTWFSKFDVPNWTRAHGFFK